MIILTLNSGSSSVKYCLFDIERQEILVRGIAERIGLDDSLIKQSSEAKQKESTFSINIPDHETAIKKILDIITESAIISDLSEIKGVAHRIVHGGEKFNESTVIDQEVKKTIKNLIPLAPLHNPANLAGITAAQTILSDIHHVAVFDTTFHSTIEQHAYRYAIPEKWYHEHGIRKYGFHGTSHYYVSKKATEFIQRNDNNELDECSKNRIITLHLGNGASITAVKGTKSIDTTMGFTPLDGLVMGTRSGDIDPGAVFYMITELDGDIAAVDKILNKKSGLLGLSGSHSDMRDIEEEAERGSYKAQLALDIASYRVAKYCGSYFVALEGLDALVFTAGIGENSPKFRKMIVDKLDCLGIKLDEKKNTSVINKPTIEDISAQDSNVKVLVIPTDEEYVMALETLRLIDL